MAIDRELAFETSPNGVLLESGTHISSGTAIPTHSGLAGDLYMRTTDSTLWTLLADGLDWVLFINGSAIVYPVQFNYNGNASSGRYLEIFPSKPSDEGPWPLTLVTRVTTFFVETDNSAGDFTVGLFEIGDLVTPVNTITLSSGQTKNTVNFGDLFAVNDELVIQVTAGSRNDPRGFFFSNTGNV